MKILTQINVGNINSVTKGFKKVDSLRLVARILGVVQTAKVVEGATSSYSEFKGEFQAYNEQGERFCAPKCILPALLNDALFSAVDAAKGKSVYFCYDISIQPDASKKIGYGYVFDTKVTPAPTDPLGDLLGKIPSFVAPVPAPAVVATSTIAPAVKETAPAKKTVAAK